MAYDADDEIRAAVFNYLDRQRNLYGDRIPWRVLQAFEHRGRRHALITQRGIRWLSGAPALTFMTTYSSDPRRAPYADHVGWDGFPRYKYQGVDPTGADNVAMKAAAVAGKPLVWFVGTGEGVYAAMYPVYVVGHDDLQLEFNIALNEEQRALWDDRHAEPAVRRRHVLRLTWQRLHQPVFRSQVLKAYETRCTICRLGHESLLGAAHIVADADGGQPVVPNGLAMCKIHHAAYDADFISVTPDYRVDVATSILEEADGPMLQHGLKDIHGWSIRLPRRAAELPDRDLLAQRHERYLLRVAG